MALHPPQPSVIITPLKTAYILTNWTKLCIWMLELNSPSVQAATTRTKPASDKAGHSNYGSLNQHLGLHVGHYGHMPNYASPAAEQIQDQVTLAAYHVI